MTTNKKEVLDLVADRIVELKGILDNIDKGIGPSGMTLSDKAKPTRKAEFNKLKMFMIVTKELIEQIATENIKLSSAAQDGLNGMLDPQTKTRLIVEEGQALLEVLKTSGKPYDTVINAATKCGLVVGPKGTFVKA